MKALAVFTNRGVDKLLREGGTQAWVLKPENAKKMMYVVCTQNRDEGNWGSPTHSQGEGFLIGKISSIDPSPEGRAGRYIVRFSEYALISVPNMAREWRNPVRYIELEDFNIDPTKLKFTPVDQPTDEPEPPTPSSQIAEVSSSATALNMTEAKKALSAFYKVPVSSIEITIRG